MTVSAATRTTSYTGDGTTTAFSFPFPYTAAAEIAVTLTQFGVTAAKILNTDYTVVAVPGGATVTFTAAPASTATVMLSGDTAISQNLALSNVTRWPMAAVEAEFDRLTMIAQEARRDIDANSGSLLNTLRAPVGETLTTLPSATGRARHVLGFDGSGAPSMMDLTIVSDTTSYVSSVSAIQALGAAYTAPTVWARGYTAGGFDGGGRFEYDPADTTSADDGGMVLVDAAGRRWKRAGGGLPSLLNWGAGVGKTAAQNRDAINAAIAGGHGGLYVPDGNFTVDLAGLQATTFTGTLTLGSATVTGIASTAALAAGMALTGAGIPVPTNIKSVDSATQITLTRNATASGPQSITANDSNKTTFSGPGTINGAHVNLALPGLWENELAGRRILSDYRTSTKFASLQINVQDQYSGDGGATGVTSAINISHIVGTEVHGYAADKPVWTLNVTGTNNSDNSSGYAANYVAQFFQAEKAAKSAVWVANWVAKDDADSPTVAAGHGSVWGMELDMKVTGSDANLLRHGIKIVGFDNSTLYSFSNPAGVGQAFAVHAGEADFHSAFRAAQDGGLHKGGSIERGFYLKDTGPLSMRGFDSTEQTDAYSDAAISLRTGHAIDWRGDLYAETIITGAVTAGSPVMTGIASTAGLSAAQKIRSGAFRAGTTILSVDSATQLTLSSNALTGSTGTVKLYAVSQIGILSNFRSDGAGARIAVHDTTGTERGAIGASSATKGFYVDGVKIVGARDTGWTAMTGTSDKATAYDTGTVTLAQLAGRVAALQAALSTHGTIGA